MPKYRSRPVVVEAVQWNKPGDHPAVNDCGLGYMALGNERCSYGLPIVVKPGDWIVDYGGKLFKVPDHIMRTAYEEITDEQ